jgi:xylan 1,4-beta-xylosidase
LTGSRGRTRRWPRLALVLSVLAPLLCGPVGGPAQSADTLGQFFPETGLTVVGDFLRAWQAAGGVAILGLPITEERLELDEGDGEPRRVQWFERTRLERRLTRPDAPIELALLGRQVLEERAATLPAAPPAPDALRFPETGQTLGDAFLAFWLANGGLPVFGFPLTGELREPTGDGQARTVQYFERARFEDLGPGASPRVRLGHLGREALQRPVTLWWEAEESTSHSFTSALFLYGQLGQDQALYVQGHDPAAPTAVYEARARVRVPRPATYTLWGRLLALDGASPLHWRADVGPWQVVDATQPPLALTAVSPHHRFAWYRLGETALPAGWHTVDVRAVPRVGQPPIAGLDALVLTSGTAPPLERAAATLAQALPAPVALTSDLGAHRRPWPRLHRGLAQGGEHPDPAYLARVAPVLRALHPTFIRLDHVFDYYEVVRRERDGRRERLTYDFGRLDAALDAVLATGAEPFLSLGLTPAILAPSGRENDPPRDLAAWRDLVYHTVVHVNQTRKLGVRYWEVWNEPNLTPFWSGTIEQYLALYRATAEAVVAADPSARVGGPATSGHEYWVNRLIDHAFVTNTRLDFISWHTYHIRPTMMANQVALLRRALDRYPRFAATELIVSEWNLNSDYGAATHFVADTEVAAAYVAAMTQTLVDAGVDAALFFEAVDGRPPPGAGGAWGRWGALTYDGRPKPVFHALDALSRLHDWRLPAASADPRVGLLVTRQEDRLALVVWSLALEPRGPQAVRLTLQHPPPGLTALRRWSIDADHGRLGEAMPEVAPVTGQPTPDGWTASLTLAPNSVTLLTWEPPAAPEPLSP